LIWMVGMRGIGLKSAGMSNPNGGREIDISDRASSLGESTSIHVR
jgi:hypothetical protein